MEQMEQSVDYLDPDIILANEPRAYREVIAGTLRALHPELAIVVLEPAELLPRLRRARPALVIHSEVAPVVELGSSASVQLYPGGAGHAVIDLVGQRTTMADFALDDLLALIGRLLAPGPGASAQTTIARSPGAPARDLRTAGTVPVAALMGH